MFLCTVDSAAPKKIILRNGRAEARADLQNNPHACRGRNTINTTTENMHIAIQATILKYTYLSKPCQVSRVKMIKNAFQNEKE